MSENAFVVIFPTVFASNKISDLIHYIKKILKIRGQLIQEIKRDDSVIVIKANDPVFASSSVNLLFGIERIAIAKQVKNEFNEVVKAITKIGSNLLLKGDKFHIKVEGTTLGYVTKDVEVSATSSLIEKTANLGVRPGTVDKYDKLLYTFLTKSNAYVCIFTDNGLGGLPYNSQKENALCCIYDELSALSCLETIRNGFDVKIILCYRKQSELVNLAQILNRVLPRTVKSKIDLEFFQVNIKGKGLQSDLLFIQTVTEILLSVAESHNTKKISLTLSPLMFSSDFIDKQMKLVFERNIIPHIPLNVFDNHIFDKAKNMGLEKFYSNIKKFEKKKFGNIRINQREASRIAKESIKFRKKITVKIGPSVVHDILDELKS